MSEEWKNLTKEQLIPVQKMAEDDKIRYQKEKEIYEKTKEITAVPKAAKKSAATKKVVVEDDE